MLYYIEYIHICSANIVLLLFILSAIGHILQGDNNHTIFNQFSTFHSLIIDFHHIKLFTGSANATKDRFINQFNFTLNSFSGPETGNKETLNYLLLNGNAKIMISSPLGNNTHTQRLMNNFLSNHGDGIGDVNINDLVSFHQSNGKIATVTGVSPPSAFGQILAKDSTVVEFNEKAQIK